MIPLSIKHGELRRGESHARLLKLPAQIPGLNPLEFLGDDVKGKRYNSCRRSPQRFVHTWSVIYRIAEMPFRCVGTCEEEVQATGFNPGRVTPDFHIWESCRAMPSAVFLGDLPLPPPFYSGAAPYSRHSPPSALKTSLLKAAQISSFIRQLSRGGVGVVLLDSPNQSRKLDTFREDLLCSTKVREFVNIHPTIAWSERARYYRNLLGGWGVGLVGLRADEGEASYTVRLPPRRTAFDSRWGRSRIFACENHVGRCHWSAGFPKFLLHAHLVSPSSTLKTSMLRAALKCSLTGSCGYTRKTVYLITGSNSQPSGRNTAVSSCDFPCRVVACSRLIPGPASKNYFARVALRLEQPREEEEEGGWVYAVHISRRRVTKLEMAPRRRVEDFYPCPALTSPTNIASSPLLALYLNLPLPHASCFAELSTSTPHCD
ncbi:hypothetical protein PR048_028774 [Dryococelus australis]|uniref:Uncharacterized protein n=1 Tax=Dryococelus australis TaxID=614101 RepID=A0ABQ9GBJ0_9NEOP|nr:hypothetical protein PR048_028774 [Dryococelus australis]